MKKLLPLTLVLTALGLVGLGMAQETPATSATSESQETQESRTTLPNQHPVPCPIPMHIHLTASSGAAPYLPDFPAKCSGGYTSTLNWTKVNTCFRYTFKWRPETECCQCTNATLTIKYKSLQGGQSATSNDAGNDSMSLWSNGSAIPGTSQALYSNFPFQPGQTGTKTIPIKCEWLKGNRLSLILQDDTAVVSATLDVVGCCIKK